MKHKATETFACVSSFDLSATVWVMRIMSVDNIVRFQKLDDIANLRQISISLDLKTSDHTPRNHIKQHNCRSIHKKDISG